jgi:hypothetical protein
MMVPGGFWPEGVLKSIKWGLCRAVLLFGLMGKPCRAVLPFGLIDKHFFRLQSVPEPSYYILLMIKNVLNETLREARDVCLYHL